MLASPLLTVAFLAHCFPPYTGMELRKLEVTIGANAMPL